MNYIYVLIFGFIAGFIAAWMVKKNKKTAYDNYFNEADKAKDENLRKVLSMLNSHETITNDQIKTELNISDSTAERYCDELEKSGKIAQVGKTGRSVTYKKALIPKLFNASE